MPRINPDRLLADLHHIRTFGASGPGVVRRGFTDVDLASRRWLRERMEAAGLDAEIDGIGNVIGRSRAAGPALLMGSHTDTQPEGGWLDGTMGVIYALEVARAFSDSDDTRDLAVDIASWMDEEGAFLSLLGSRSFCGELTSAIIAEVRNAEGRSLAQAITAAGLDGVERRRLEPDRHVAYLEAHIEQGGVLEAQGKRIGVVTGIVGIRNFILEFTGAQNHAGTTPMPIRKDAGMALIHLAHAIDARFAELTGERTVWTFGHVSFEPGASSIVPGRARMLIQFRDPEATVVDAFVDGLKELVAAAGERGPVAVSMELKGIPIEPAPMDPNLQDHIAEAAEVHAPGDWMRMPSGAGHDAQVFAKLVPSAMLFVPSIGGISHDFSEDTKEEDIALGCQVFADAAARILKARARIAPV